MATPIRRDPTHRKMPRAMTDAGVSYDDYLQKIRAGLDFCNATEHEGDRWVANTRMSGETTARCMRCRRKQAVKQEQRRKGRAA